MKVYAQYLTKDLNGNIVEAMGSDSVFILDGRNKPDTMINDSLIRMNQLRNIHPDYIGFRIYQGERIQDGNQSMYVFIND
jgi:hypothetical protein